MTFAKLNAGTGITLDAASAWSAGNAIVGGSLLVSSGGVSLLARAGHLTVGTLSAAALSHLETKAGSVRVSRVSRLRSNQLQVDVVGGTKILPRGF